MFQLSEREKNELVAICDRLKPLKHSSSRPFAFTEQGVAMLSSILKSKRAVLVNIVIMRVFVRLRYLLSTNKELALKLKELEGKVNTHDSEIQAIFETIKQLTAPEVKEGKRMGFV